MDVVHQLDRGSRWRPLVAGAAIGCAEPGMTHSVVGGGCYMGTGVLPATECDQ